MKFVLSFIVLIACIGVIYGRVPFEVPKVNNGAPVSWFNTARRNCRKIYNPDLAQIEQLYGQDEAYNVPDENLKKYVICVMQQGDVIDTEGRLIDNPVRSGIFDNNFEASQGKTRAAIIGIYEFCKKLESDDFIEMVVSRAMCAGVLYGGRVF